MEKNGNIFRIFDEYIFRLPQGTLTQLDFCFQNIARRRIKFTETSNYYTIKSKIHKHIKDCLCSGLPFTVRPNPRPSCATRLLIPDDQSFHRNVYICCCKRLGIKMYFNASLKYQRRIYCFIA